MDVNNNEPVFYPYSIKINKCGGFCGGINNPYAKICIPDITRSINVRVFNLMQRINETRRVIWHETCKCMCRLTSAVCNTKQVWNEDKCRCKCKEDLIDKGICDKGFNWNPSNCQCERDRSCGTGEYLDYKNYVCRNSIADKLIEECTNVIDRDKIYNETLIITPLNTIPLDDCASGTLYVVSLTVFLTTSVIIGGVFVYYWYLKKKNAQSNP